MLVAGLIKRKFRGAEGWVGAIHWGTFKALVHHCLPSAVISSFLLGTKWIGGGDLSRGGLQDPRTRRTVFDQALMR